MRYIKILGMLVIFCFCLALQANSIAVSLPTTDREIAEIGVINKEAAIDEAFKNDSWKEDTAIMVDDFINENSTNSSVEEVDSYRSQVAEEIIPLYDYIKELTGDHPHVVYEILLMMKKQFTQDQIKMFLTYVKANPQTRSNIMKNAISGQLIGYFNTQFVKWRNLPMEDKIALLDTDKHHIDGAFELMSRMSPTELMYVNGWLDETPWGYTNWNLELAKMVSLGSKADKEDIARLNAAGDNLSEQVFKAHFAFMQKTDAEINDFYFFVNMTTGDEDALEKKLYTLTKYKDSLDNVMEQLGDIEYTYRKEGNTLTSIATSFIILGAILLAVAALCVLAPTLLGVLTLLGVGFLLAGCGMLPSGAIALDQANKLAGLRSKLSDSVQIFDNMIDDIMDALNNYADSMHNNSTGNNSSVMFPV